MRLHPLRSRLAACLLALVVGCGSSSSSDAGPAEDTGVADGAADSPSTTTTDVSLLVMPEDGEAAIYDPIRNASKSVHCEVYMLTDNGALNALVAAKKAGKDVKVLLEHYPYPTTTANDAAFKSLTAAGVDVRWTSSKYALTHSKFFVVDGVVAYVMTLNLTNAGVGGNREYAAVVRDADDVAQAEAIFEADLTGATPPPGGKLLASPIDARARLLALIDAATKTIDIEMEEFSDAEVASHLVTRIEAGVAVRVVAPSSGRSTGTSTTLGSLRANRATIKVLATPDLHAKLIVVDGTEVYLGSVNLTAASLDRNREVGVLTRTGAVVTRAKATFEADFAKAVPL